MKLEKLLFVLSVLFLVNAGTTRAQSLDPYRRMNDPLAICNLSGPDSVPIYYAFIGGFDSIQGYADGPGIIRSFWDVFARGECGDTNYMSLWVDDSLFFTGTACDFFSNAHGLIGAPLDTFSSGADVCETQIPFKKHFVWTYSGFWHWSAVAWQPIDTTHVSLPSIGSASYANEQASANQNYWNRPPQFPDTVQIHAMLNPGDSITLIDKAGPAYLQQFRFLFPPSDSAPLDRLWIECYWDDDPTPSVAMPLSDLFGAAIQRAAMHAEWISVDTSTGVFQLFFPMPFKVHARIVLVNRDAPAVPIQGAISWKDTTWNPSWGYFSAQYGTTTAIPYHIFHPLLHVKGHGRYIGAILNFPAEVIYPSFLEGDVYVDVDSLPFNNPGISVHYGGMEDYCNGGWYFFSPVDTSRAMVPFSDPFRGCPVFPTTIYRFHANSPYDYSRSLDIDVGHGFYDDFTVNFRTSAFYYKEWTPFYPSSDTIAPGNIWRITGAGFIPNTLVLATLDTTLLYTGIAEPDGTISLHLPVTASWPVGTHTLRINGMEKPELITVLASPKLLYIADSAQPIYSECDSIDIRCYGFHANESLELLLGDSIIAASAHVVADSDGCVKLHTFLPWVPEGSYLLRVRRANGSFISSDSTLYVTRTLDEEFEQMPCTGSTYGTPTPTYYSQSNWHLSQGEFCFCFGNWTPGSTFTFQFTVPFTDTFAPTLFALKGDRYAIYRISIDGTDVGSHDWFLPQSDPLRDSEILAPIYLTAGVHTITCFNSGHDDSTREYSFGPDNITLRPLSPGSRPDAVPIVAVPVPISIYPNPLNESMLFLQGIDSLQEVPVRIYNEVGQQVLQMIVPLSNGGGWIDASDLSNGSYWIVLELRTGSKALHLNVVK